MKMNYKMNEVYKLVIKLQRNKERIFKGKLIQEISRFITIQGEKYTESFLKTDIGREIKFI